MSFYKIYFETCGPAYHIRKMGDPRQCVLCGIDTKGGKDFVIEDTTLYSSSKWLEEACCKDCFKVKLLEELGE